MKNLVAVSVCTAILVFMLANEHERTQNKLPEIHSIIYITEGFKLARDYVVPTS
jgi:hypothetical protein